MINKKGQGAFALLAVTVLITILLAIGYSVASSQSPETVAWVENLPEGVGSILDIYGKILTPAFNGFKLIVVPDDFRGEDELSNEAMIAIGIFLLLTVVGAHTLRPLFPGTSGQLITLLVSAIIGVIASRSLTEQVLDSYPIGASSLAAVFFLLGILPIFGIQLFLNRWFGLRPGGANGDPILIITSGRLVVWILCAITYWFVFTYGFNATALGWIYAIGIIIFGIGDLIWAFLSVQMAEARHRRMGGFVQRWMDTITTTRQAMRGAQQQQQMNLPGI